MVLNHLRRGKDVTRDVRRFAIQTEGNVPRQTRRSLLPEAEAEKIIRGNFNNQSWANDLSTDLRKLTRLKYVFPDQGEAIYRLWGHDQDYLADNLHKIIEQEHPSWDFESMLFFAEIRLFTPEFDLQEFLPQPGLVIKMINDYLEVNNLRENIDYLMHLFWAFKILYPNYPLTSNTAALVRTEGKKRLTDLLVENTRWHQHLDIAAYFRCAFPEEFKTLDYRKYMPEYLEMLERFKDIEESRNSTLGVTEQAFYLTILDADEIVFDEAGMHVIYHNTQEQLETFIPEQPIAREL